MVPERSNPDDVGLTVNPALRPRCTGKPDIISASSCRPMQTPRRINDPANSLAVVVAIVLSALLLLGQALFIVPAGKVAVVTTLGKVSGGARLPGLNLKVPFIQSVYPFDVRTQVKPEEFATLTNDLQVIEATATVKYAVRPNEAGRIYRTIAGNDR